jgi:arylsulfatase A-like enzyme
MNRRDFLRMLALTSLAPGPFLSVARARSTSPNLILISIDSLRADHLGCYGYPKPTSPSIDALAKEGFLFRNAVSTTTWTLPAHISMLTALYPQVHQVVGDGHRLNPNAVVCTEILKQHGYRTAGFVSAPLLSSVFGYNQGFDIYDDYTIRFPSLEDSHQGATAPDLHAQVGKWIEGNYHDPFFLFLHYWDVHYDYAPPPPFDTLFDPNYTGEISGRDFFHDPRIVEGMPARDLQHVLALYDGEIAFTDSYIGRLFELLKRLGIYENSIIVVTSDHGDEFFEHGCKGHRNNLFDETLCVPLIIKFPHGNLRPDLGPRLPLGTRIAEQVSIVDIVPTFLDCLGIDPGMTFDGRSLMPLLLTAAADARTARPRFERYVFAELYKAMQCLRTNRYKYLRIPDRYHSKDGEGFNMARPRGRLLSRVLEQAQQNHGLQAGEREAVFLLDLMQDPAEQTNLALAQPDRVVEFHRLLTAWLAGAETRAVDLPSLSIEHDERMREALKSLGYID